MSDFQKDLDQEIEKRQHDEEKKTVKPKAFSFTTFFSGLAICFLLTAALIGWAWLKAEQTNKSLQEKLPSKTAIVKAIDDGEVQTTLTMPKIETPASPKAETNDDTEQVTAPHTPKNVEEVTKTSPKEDVATTNTLNADEKRPFKLYQSPFTAKTNKPLLSIVITDLGLSSKKTANIIQNFSKEISFSFSPYARDLNNLTNTAKEDGHEIWLSLPLETKEYPLNDPGPSALLVNASTEKNTARLHSLLNSAQGYVGFISQPNHVFKIEDANVNPAIKEIFERGLAVIDSSISIRSFIDALADKNDYPYTQNDLWLDDDLSPLSMNKNIRQISQFGEQGKNVIVMLRPYPASLKTIQKFLNSKAADVFEIAPVSAQLKNNE